MFYNGPSLGPITFLIWVKGQAREIAEIVFGRNSAANGMIFTA